MPRTSADAGSFSIPCPACGTKRSSVLDSRNRGRHTMRRRRCVSCAARFSTVEILSTLEFDESDLAALEGQLADAHKHITFARERIANVRTAMAQEEAE